ncbi:protein adenylyltransferase SelO [Ningiella sp. W23]|uniref:protein adenylyltransferase SelO n=1 Tax=Ningiella sp. W23 TaxID=3023715 RepID=UPI00375731D9
MKNQAYSLGLNQRFTNSLSECCIDAHALDFPHPKLVYINHDLMSDFKNAFPESGDELARLFSGQQLPIDAKPVAQAYAGHQFGHFNPQLGDGRAMTIGELENSQSKLFELDFKGSGPTPFSRGGDGKAALGPMLREVLISEAMAALGVPTTRSLAVTTTGETVYRDPPQAGAVLARTAASKIRIGTFQYFAAREQYDVLQKLIDFCIERHFPNLRNKRQEQNDSNQTLTFLKESIAAQAKLVAKWMGLGFIHGVMNTDNMLISGETIDYGPCAFMDTYDPKTVFSSIDRNSRYAYMNQPAVAQWNLSRFAETLLPLIAKEQDDAASSGEEHQRDRAIELATEAVQDFIPQYESAFREVMCNKLGLKQSMSGDIADEIIAQWQGILLDQKLDWTQAHVYLTQILLSKQKLTGDLTLVAKCQNPEPMLAWLALRHKHSVESAETMESINPVVIPRNHLVEEALSLAQKTGDLSAFTALLASVQQPFTWPDDIKYTQAAPPAFNEDFMTFCGT